MGTRRKNGMAQHRKEPIVYFAVDGEDGYYIGSTEWPEERRREHEQMGKSTLEEFATTHENRYDDEYELIEFAEGMGIPLTNTHRTPHGKFGNKRAKMLKQIRRRT
jgi:glyoxylate utilization-related uncharacterized protein